jgi:predicted Holliday junction resolvase-like endonuclease
MDLLWVLLGIVIGVAISAWLFRMRERVEREDLHEELARAEERAVETYAARAETERARIVRVYEARIHHLQEQHRADVAQTRTSTVNASRAVLKGKMAEQIAPLLPGFAYWPSDARFLGDPVDYVVFDGYSASKDDHTDGLDIELVILDIKRGKSMLTREQRRIADAVAAGRVRFEVVRVLSDGTVRTRVWRPQGRVEASAD